MKHLFTFFLALFFVQTTFASSFLELFGAPDTTNPFNTGLICKSGTSSYFNPALLALNKKDSGKLNVFSIVKNFDISYADRGTKYDVPADIYKTASNEITKNGRYAPIATKDLLNKRGSYDNNNFSSIVSLSFVKQILKDRLVAGVFFLLPTTSVQTQTPFFNDEREAFFSNSLHFELFDDRTQQLNIAFSLGIKITDSFMLGAGLSFTNHTITESEVYVPDSSDPSLQLINSKVKVVGEMSPLFGFLSKPWKNLFISGAVHFPSNTGTIDMKNDTQVFGWDYDGKTKGSLKSTMNMTFGYEPLRITGGIGYAFHLKNVILTTLFSAKWNRWSTYINRHGEKPNDKWSDTISISAGINFMDKNRKIGFDFTYVPSPVPNQTGRENYVDNDRIGFAGGYSEFFRFKNFTIAGGINAQIQYLLTRTTLKDGKLIENNGCVGDNCIVDEFPDDTINYEDKEHGYASAKGLQTNNPGFPGFKTKGFVVGSGLFIKIMY